MLRLVVCLVFTAIAASEIAELFRFKRTIEETGKSFFKMKMTLGSCAEKELFKESKVWANVRMNRVFDIYYRSDNPDYTVSKVEITMVLNNTDVNARSDNGVGFPEFSGFVVLPTRAGVVMYTLIIYTCSNSNQALSNKFKYNATYSPAFIDQFGADSSNEDYSDDDEDDT